MNILYTIVPMAIIFGEEEEERAGGRAEVDVEAGPGRFLTIGDDGRGGSVITRLHSTDPRDYLDRRWQPGSRWRG